MLLKCLATGSTGNSYILTSDNGKHLILDAGIPIKEIKKGLDFDIENVEGCLISHSHNDHAKSANHLKVMGIPVFQPYLFGAKRLKIKLVDFQIESFPVPHNGVENRGFIITVDEQKICFLIDLEFCPYDLSKQGINVLIVECNYISDLVDDSLPNIVHKTLGHCELQTTIGIIQNCKKHLRKVILTHMSKGATMDKERALKEIKSNIPEYIEVVFAKENTVEDISEIPF